MKRTTLATSLITAGLLTGAVIHFARADSDDKPAGDDKNPPTATVTTAPLTQGDLSQNIVAYGSVIAQPGEVAVSAVPYECRVTKVVVTGGQPIDKGSDLVHVEPSPAAKLALHEAQNNLEAASKDLQQSQQRFDMKLATGSDLLQSQQAMKLAQLRLDSLQQQGGSETLRLVLADSAGLIAKVDVQQGQIVPAGNPLVESVARDQVEVRLGVEPSDISKLSIGQEVHLFPNNASDFTAGKIRLITQRVNPDTRLVDVFVAPASQDAMLLDSFVRAEIVASVKAALIAPRNAVLPDDEGLLLYTVKDRKAVKHIVTIAAQNDDAAAVVSKDLHAGDTIVTLGNLELEDGMAVTTETSPEEPR